MEKNLDKINRLRRFLICKFGEKEGIKRCGNLMRGSSLKVLQFKYGKDLGLYKYNQKIEIDKFKNTLPGFIKKYGVGVGTEKYIEKNKKLSVSVNALKLSGRSDDEIKDIKEKHSINSKTDLESMIKRHGEKEGRLRYKKKIDSGYSCRNYKSVMKYYNISEDEAKKIVSKNQMRGLDYYIKKYGSYIGKIKYDNANKKRAYAGTKDYYISKFGNIKGLEKYKEVCYDRGKSGRLEYYIDKFGEIEGNARYLDMIKKKVSYFPDFSSNIEKDFSLSLYSLLNDNQKEVFYGAPLTKPFFINLDSSNYSIKCIVPDIKIGKIVIEFDGDYWHSLPNNIERDRLKNMIYDAMGLKLIRVKESDYLKNKQLVIENTINLIKNYEN